MLYRRVTEMLKGFTWEFQVFAVDLAMSALVEKYVTGLSLLKGSLWKSFEVKQLIPHELYG